MKKLIAILGLLPVMVLAQPSQGGGPFGISPAGNNAFTGSNYFGSGFLSEITVSAGGRANSLSGVINDGAMFGPDTAGTTTCGLQEAFNALPNATNNMVPGGGRIHLSPGIFYTSTPISVAPSNGTGFVIEGDALNGSAICWTGSGATTNVLTFSRTGGGSYGDQAAVFLRDVLVSALTNGCHTLVYVAPYCRVVIENCWFGPWAAITNNKIASTLVGFSTATSGGYNGDTNLNLVGVAVGGSGDMVTVRGCSFLSLALGLDVNSDHMTVAENTFSFCGGYNGGKTNAWPVNSPYYIGGGVHYYASYPYGNFAQFHNFFYTCGNGVFCEYYGAANDTRAVVGYSDSFESCQTDVALTTDARYTEVCPTGFAGSTKATIIGKGWTSAGTTSGVYTNTGLAAEPGRVKVIGQGQIIGSDLSINSLITVSNNLGAWTNVLVGGFPTAAANGLYPPTVTNGSSVVYCTNAATGYYVVYDPLGDSGGGSVNPTANWELYNSAHTELTAWADVDGDGYCLSNEHDLGSGGAYILRIYDTSKRVPAIALGDRLWTSGTGTPEGAVTAPIGSLFSRKDGGATTSLYVKTSGTGNTGWTAK